MLVDMISYLKEKRLFLQWTQKDLAEESAMSQSVISRIENGHDGCNMREFFALAETLDIDREEMLVHLDLKSPRRMLDEARIYNDYKAVEDILNRIPKNIRLKNRHLNVYYIFHDALIDYQNEKFETAHVKFIDALFLLKMDNFSNLLLAEIYLMLGITSHQLNKITQNYFKRASDIIQTVKITEYNFKHVVRVHCNLAAIYCRREFFTLVIKELNIANEILKQFQSTYLKLEIEYAKCLCYVNTNHPETAEQMTYVEYLLKDHPNEKIKRNLENIRIRIKK